MAQSATRKPTKRASSKDLNPLLGAWRTPFRAPPFAKIEPRHFAPAFRLALREHKKEIAEITGKQAKPNFKNTIAALEKSGALLDRTADVFFNLTSAHTSTELQTIEREITPKIAEHWSALMLNRKLFERVSDLYERRDALGLDKEQARLLERIYKGFVRAGAKLGPKPRKRILEINVRLAQLGTQFAQNVLADEQDWHMVLKTERDLAGLPDTVRAAAAEAAEQMGYKGQHVITLARSSVEAFLQFSSRRDLREEAWRAWTERGERGGKTDNRALLVEILELRAEMADLLGYDTYADFVLEDTMAKTPAAVRGLVERVWTAGVAKAAEEAEALQERARDEGNNAPIAAWDWRYYAEKERLARFDLDDDEIRQYFELDNILAAAFDTAGKLFGIKFTEIEGFPVYHDDVRAWEVTTKRGNEHVGVFLGDYFARPSKRSGAWMSSFRGQSKLTGDVRPIVVNVMSIPKAAAGNPTLLSYDDAHTLFHELGHGLHGLLSDVTYPSLAMTNVTRDFVELPSQLYEHWIDQPEVLKTFALHYKTGKPIPDRLLKKLKAARTFNQGFQTVEYTASALLDMELHAGRHTGKLDISAFEKSVMKKIGMPKEIVPRHRAPHFQHIIGGYAVGYYSYLWSEVMDADAFSAFEEAGDIFDKKTARKLKTHIYSAGNRADPNSAYIAFRGRPPEVDGLLRRRGLV